MSFMQINTDFFLFNPGIIIITKYDQIKIKHDCAISFVLN